MVKICGIDDAGRGPVIGPMVLAGILIDEKDLDKLKELGAKDSKDLTPKQRELIYSKIVKEFKIYKIVKSTPQQIDQALNSSNSNLNWFEADKMIEIINTLNPEKVIIDCPSNNIPAFTEYLENKIKTKTQIICEHKADSKYPIVGAASILAKVTRDAEIEKIKKELRADFGSGYPSDPKTKKFLKENWNKYPGIFRTTWSSYKNVSEGKNSKKQKTLADF
ncbi:ribonuclease HII [Candidatus Woesearchaeota archaeon]|nr:ribonuclease HII [Candidatus Woesearchaeota archaeon]